MGFHIWSEFLSLCVCLVVYLFVVYLGSFPKLSDEADKKVLQSFKKSFGNGNHNLRQ